MKCDDKSLIFIYQKNWLLEEVQDLFFSGSGTVVKVTRRPIFS